MEEPSQYGRPTDGVGSSDMRWMTDAARTDYRYKSRFSLTRSRSRALEGRGMMQIDDDPGYHFRTDADGLGDSPKYQPTSNVSLGLISYELLRTGDQNQLVSVQ
jgi:hypothetical protein